MRSVLSILALSLLLLPVGCGDSTTPAPLQADEAVFEGVIDPGDGSFLLARIDQPGVVPLLVDLVGSNLVADPEHQLVSLDVSLVNRGPAALHPRAILWLFDLQPPRVMVANPDILPPTMEPASPLPSIFGFDYSEFLGEDAILEPGEASQPKHWVFHNPEMVSFSFAARAEFELEAPSGWISGTVFEDRNQNGFRDSDEGPFIHGEIQVTPPEGEPFWVRTEADGSYRVPAEAPGLYVLRLEILVDCVSCVTTPNPRQVLIVQDPAGSTGSVSGVDFGAVCAPCGQLVPPVLLVDAPPDSVTPQARYSLLGAWVEGTRMHLRVGFSGCSPDHPFQLVAGRGFMESNPVATWLRLLHDDHGEVCLAYFERDLVFELTPIQLAHIEAYGEPGVVRLLLRTPDGITHEYRLEP